MPKSYRHRAIETIAQNTLTKYNPILVNGEPQEVPIEDIIEMHFGIILQYRNLSKTGRILGITCFEDCIYPIYDENYRRYEGVIAKEGTIIIDKRLLAKNNIKRLRFTLAHELGHYILHSEYYRETEQTASKLSTDSDTQTEREADELAAALLMPQGRLKVAFRRLNNKYNKTETIRYLAEMFNVSTQSMEIRLMKTGLSKS